MKVTKRQLKQTIQEEVRRALEEAGDVPWENGGTTVPAGAGEADPLEMLKKVKELVDKAIADLAPAADAPAEKKGHKYVPTKVDPSLDKPRPYSPEVPEEYR